MSESNKRLEILFVSPYMPYPPAHGGAVRMFNLIKLLSERHNISLLTFCETEGDLKHRAILEKYCKQVKIVLRQGEPRIKNPFKIKPRIVEDLTSREMQQELEKFLADHSFDVVQIEFTQMAHYLPANPKVITALTEHDVTFLTFFRFFQTREKFSEKVKALIEWAAMLRFELGMLGKYDIIFSVSEKEKALLQSFRPNLNVTSAPNGVDIDYYQPLKGENYEPKSLLFIGSFFHLPNTEGILYFYNKIFPMIKKKIPDIRLYIVGANPTAEILALQKDPNVIVTGFVEDLRTYYQKCSIFVVPIYRGAGTRIKILEAMAAGIPVISTRVGAEGIEYIDGENIIIADQDADFAEAVVKLISDNQLKENLIRSGRKLMEARYSWQETARRMEDAYLRVISCRS